MLMITDNKTITLLLSDLTQAITDYLQKNNVLIAGSSMTLDLLVSSLTTGSSTPVVTITLTSQEN